MLSLACIFLLLHISTAETLNRFELEDHADEKEFRGGHMASGGQDLGTGCFGEVKGRLAVKGFEDSERMPCWYAAL